MNEKLMINAALLRKESEFRTKSCVVEKAVAVSHDEFYNLKSHPLRDNDLITEHSEMMFCDDDGVYHCLLIYDKENGDGLLIESEGSPYARYAQYVPNAKLLYENHMQTHSHEMRLCCPLEIYQYVEDYPPECCILDNEEMAKYADEINQGIKENDLPEERERGLMHWYHPNDDNNELDNKVHSAHCSVEIINGELTGVITTKVMGELSDEALAQFIGYCTGQLSDGWGESLGQKYIRSPTLRKLLMKYLKSLQATNLSRKCMISGVKWNSRSMMFIRLQKFSFQNWLITRSSSLLKI
ncbi:MAG: hypothetical protein IJY19_07690 [Ruminococcus sp.]|nr:hypothetical protein [Ruminococcus sp.]